MKTKSMKLALFALCGLMLLPQSAAAYEVTDSQAYRLDDTTYLFTVSYKFGFLNREMATPIFATRSEADGTKVEYAIEVNNEPASGIMGAVVLTKDEDVVIEDGYYTLPRGRNAEFTLVGIVRTETDVTSAGLQITKLPYLTHDDGQTWLGGVTDEELLEYRSPIFVNTTEGTATIETSVITVITSEK